jgi:hypothetical protein
VLIFSMPRYHDQASALNVSATDLYNALLANAEKQPPNWNLQGRQANAWKAHSKPQISPLGFDVVLINLTFVDYIPKDSTDGGGTNTKQVSRTLEVWLTFAVYSRLVLTPLNVVRVW